MGTGEDPPGGVQFLVDCDRTLRVALYSRQTLAELREETGIGYARKDKGILHFYRDAKEFEHAIQAAETMRGHGLDIRILDAM